MIIIIIYFSFTFLGPAGDQCNNQKPPTPQQLWHKHHEQSTGTTGGAVTQSSGMQCQRTPTPTTANPHQACTNLPGSNQASPHPSPLYPGLPQANQPNGNTQGKLLYRLGYVDRKSAFRLTPSILLYRPSSPTGRIKIAD